MLEYNPTTGLFRNVPPCSNNACREWYAGSSEKARSLSVWFKARNMRAHRVAWYLHYGKWPTYTIDHINGNPTDNRIANLRDVPQAVNNQNILVARKHNDTGVLGVTKFRNKYRARLTINGTSFHLGLFNTLEEASTMYRATKAAYHGSPNMLEKEKVA